MKIIKEKKNKYGKVECPYCGNIIPVTHSASFIDDWFCPDCKNQFVFDRQFNTSKLDWVVEVNRLSNLNMLPSEQQKAVKAAIEELEKEKEFYIEEPCDCGSHIRHNNGGNYHDWIEIKIDEGLYFLKEGCTSELEPPYTWELSTKEKVYSLIQDCADWL